MLWGLFRNFGIHLQGQTGMEVYLCRCTNLSTGCYKVPSRSFQLCLRGTIVDWFRKNHKWTRGHTSQQDHAIMQPSSKSIRICESRCYKRDQATVSVDFGCGEPSRNHKDETPSNKFARLLQRFWKGNQIIY